MLPLLRSCQTDFVWQCCKLLSQLLLHSYSLITLEIRVHTHPTFKLLTALRSQKKGLAPWVPCFGYLLWSPSSVPALATTLAVRTLQLLLQLEPHNAPVTILDAATPGFGPTESSCCAPRRCSLLLQNQQDAPAILLEAATADSGEHRTLQQRAWTLQLLLP